MKPWLAFLVLLLLAPVAVAQQRPSPLGERIMQGAMIGGRLWLRNDNGVAAFADKDGHWIVQAHDVIALERRGEALWLLSRKPSEAQTLTIAATDHGRRQMWTLELADGEKAVALLPHDQPVVLSDEAFYRLQGQDWRRTPIVQVGPPSHVAIGVPVAALTTDGRSLYVGYNMGEWGGELDRIDLATGHEVEWLAAM